MPRAVHLAAVCTLALGVTGCVVPIGPEFEVRPNSPPYLVAANPPLGSITTVPDFTIQFGDADLDDTLHLVVLADYPPISGDQRPLLDAALPPAGAPERAATHVMPDCLRNNLVPDLDVHRIFVAVSDRPWRVPAAGEVLTPEEEAHRYTLPSPRARVYETQWLLRMTCP